MFTMIVQLNNKRAEAMIIDETPTAIVPVLKQWIEDNDVKYFETSTSLVINNRKQIVGRIKFIQADNGLADPYFESNY